MNRVNPRRVSAILKGGRGRPIAVVGDVMLDEFLWGRVSRISPEAPVPVVEVTHESFRLGGAANVAHNLLRLGADPRLIGVFGEDHAAERLRRALREIGISEAGLIRDPSRPTTLKTRTIAHSQQVVRADRESREDLAPGVEERLLETTAEALRSAEALVLSDYSKGTLTPRVLERTIALSRRKGIPVLVDPKLKRFSAYRKVSLVTPNIHEAEAATGLAIDGLADLERAAKQILSALECQAVLITRGDQGMSLFERQKRPLHIAATAREVFDVTGAGDTVIATAAFVLGAGGSFGDAAVLANQAAGIAVAKLGTATVDPEELLRSLGAEIGS